MNNTNNASLPQFVWGVLLAFVGISMFFAIPEKMDQISEIEQYSTSIRFFISSCFYLISIILVGGGLRKIFVYFNRDKDTE